MYKIGESVEVHFMGLWQGAKILRQGGVRSNGQNEWVIYLDSLYVGGRTWSMEEKNIRPLITSTQAMGYTTTTYKVNDRVEVFTGADWVSATVTAGPYATTVSGMMLHEVQLDSQPVSIVRCYEHEIRPLHTPKSIPTPILNFINSLTSSDQIEFKATTKPTKVPNHNCPSCGDSGEWRMLALVCRNGHGIFAG